MAAAPRTDFKKQYRNLYSASAEPEVVDVPALPFLAVDGVGDPSGPAYRRAVEALYAASYALRFALKREAVVEYPVMPLEGLWWAPGRHDLPMDDRDAWHWTMMIMQPPQADAGRVADALAEASRRRPDAAVDRVEFREVAEGPSVQLLHTGPYAEEGPAVRRLLSFAEEHGYRISGRHHEIYLSNPARTAPERLRTILRYPVSRG
ncbi:GyrI-like domain-containing protein [Thermobifida cellulosilytica]|uniref:GyrI-like small molecule binding domain-containing protein n=1 Tax=Thermobifida cellulosilytica TB100 TaxID=665004 RepID=A0A147KL62_THECS|nr:GyrI-like domain-containing protein [Thermobifida cellulosilytica]KUP97979.1 hypothetical protein AC529_04175 [Thermobifida cellulosilytica TB100]